MTKTEHMFYNQTIPQEGSDFMGYKEKMIKLIQDTDDEKLIYYIYMVMKKIMERG